MGSCLLSRSSILTPSFVRAVGYLSCVARVLQRVNDAEGTVDVIDAPAAVIYVHQPAMREPGKDYGGDDADTTHGQWRSMSYEIFGSRHPVLVTGFVSVALRETGSSQPERVPVHVAAV